MFELSEVKTDVTWKQAKSYAKSLGDGWRVPTKEELQIIQASTKAKEFAKDGIFWSSSINVGYAGNAWVVGFGYGGVGFTGKTYSCGVRCVRGSHKDLLRWCFENVW